MKNIKVLGSGCRKCEIRANAIAQAAKEAGVEIELDTVTDISEIMSFGVMSTPGVVVNGKVVHSDRRRGHADWLAARASARRRRALAKELP